MPIVPFESMPDDARAWIFGARAPLDEVDGPRLLGAVDAYLKTWRAHGTPLVCARDFRDDHFLVVAVDERASDASGCSIDGLFNVLQEIEAGIGTTMVGGGTIFFRAPIGMVHACTRAEFAHMAAMGEIDLSTPVFDLTLGTVGEYRSGFEKAASQSWHSALMRGTGSDAGRSTP